MELCPYLFCLFFCLFYFSYLLSKTMGCFSGCLMSSAGIQKLFSGIYSAFKCSFDEFVGEKVVSPPYSSAILGPCPHYAFRSLNAAAAAAKSLQLWPTLHDLMVSSPPGSPIPGIFQARVLESGAIAFSAIT